MTIEALAAAPLILYDTFAFIARSDAPLSPTARAFVEIVERRLERVAEAALYAAGTSETD